MKETKATKKSLALSAGEGLFVRKGALVDSGGALALSLMGSAPLGVHFSEVVLQLQSEAVPCRLMLAAFNGSLVGVCLGGDSAGARRVWLQVPRGRGASRASQGGRGRTAGGDGAGDMHVEGGDEGGRGGGGRGEDIACDNIGTGNEHENVEDDCDEAEEEDEDEGFEIRCDTYAPHTQELSVCLGLGIVRAVDVERQLLYLITPLSPALLNAHRGERDVYTDDMLGCCT